MVATGAIGVNPVSGHYRAMDLDMGLDSRLDHSLDPGAPRGPQSMAPDADSKQATCCGPDPMASMWALVTTCTMDFNTDPGFSRITGPNMVLFSSLGHDVTMVPGGYECHPGVHGPYINTATGDHQNWGVSTAHNGNRSHELQHRSWLQLGHVIMLSLDEFF